MIVPIKLKLFSFSKVAFVAAHVDERRAGNLDFLIDACQVLMTKSVLVSLLLPF